MSVVRNLERRLERLLEGVAGRVFSGRVHPSELAGKLAREADFARFQHFTGPATANHFVIRVSPNDLAEDPSKLEETLTAEMTAYTTEEGLRLEGPVTVRIEPLDGATPGKVQCHVEVVPGP
ncbi:MAG TPA: FhaA domain-containing protein, partial [Acidimicrobiia bacterium]|nr:FhaA domain-containing protein [Acidimicrobiia bacterium]